MLAVNQTAPNFCLPDKEGNIVCLESFLGKKVVVYFYPKDNTPGCTRQACAFRDWQKEFAKRDVVVIGISKDNQSSHQKFAQKFELNFPILSDADAKVMEAYGAFGTKKMYGKTFLGVIRCTFVIDEQGKIEKVFPKANPDNNAEDILKFLDQ